mmetsp:Transcript_11093/g.17100  ORF Transcript_11093/g.17100 Transcript_11093/m.17100 type:complete len:316 (+) Transcript_11093:72-1019(+)
MVLVNHDIKYHATCFIAGGFSSSIRWVLTPLDLVKIQMQVRPLSVQASQNNGVTATLRAIYLNEGLSGLFRGLSPTILASFVQTSCKYGLYEIFKDCVAKGISGITGDSEESVRRMHRAEICVTSAAMAETVADIAMCPFEMLKVQIQAASSPTAKNSFPSQLLPAVSQMMQQRKQYNFPFGSIFPLWARQVPGTVLNFFVFESTASIIYESLLPGQKEDYSSRQQLCVSFGAGYIAGFCNAAISHPADSIISCMALSKYQGMSVHEIIQDVGLYRLATKGLLPRMVVTGQVISTQWLLYDTIKCFFGFGTSGGE